MRAHVAAAGAPRPVLSRPLSPERLSQCETHLFVGLSSDHQIAGSVRHDLPVRNVPRFESCIFSVPHGT